MTGTSVLAVVGKKKPGIGLKGKKSKRSRSTSVPRRRLTASSEATGGDEMDVDAVQQNQTAQAQVQTAPAQAQTQACALAAQAQVAAQAQAQAEAQVQAQAQGAGATETSPAASDWASECEDEAVKKTAEKPKESNKESNKGQKDSVSGKKKSKKSNVIESSESSANEMDFEQEKGEKSKNRQAEFLKEPSIPDKDKAKAPRKKGKDKGNERNQAKKGLREKIVVTLFPSPEAQAEFVKVTGLPWREFFKVTEDARFQERFHAYSLQETAEGRDKLRQYAKQIGKYWVERKARRGQGESNTGVLSNPGSSNLSYKEKSAAIETARATQKRNRAMLTPSPSLSDPKRQDARPSPGPDTTPRTSRTPATERLGRANPVSTETTTPPPPSSSGSAAPAQTATQQPQAEPPAQPPSASEASQANRYSSAVGSSNAGASGPPRTPGQLAIVKGDPLSLALLEKELGLVSGDSEAPFPHMLHIHRGAKERTHQLRGETWDVVTEKLSDLLWDMEERGEVLPVRWHHFKSGIGFIACGDLHTQDKVRDIVNGMIIAGQANTVRAWKSEEQSDLQTISLKLPKQMNNAEKFTPQRLAERCAKYFGWAQEDWKVEDEAKTKFGERLIKIKTTGKARQAVKDKKGHIFMAGQNLKVFLGGSILT